MPTPSRLLIGRIIRRIEKISELRRADVEGAPFAGSPFANFAGSRRQETGKALERDFEGV
jgi:hypothetical protein